MTAIHNNNTPFLQRADSAENQPTTRATKPAAQRKIARQQEAFKDDSAETFHDTGIKQPFQLTAQQAHKTRFLLRVLNDERTSLRATYAQGDAAAREAVRQGVDASPIQKRLDAVSNRWTQVNTEIDALHGLLEGNSLLAQADDYNKKQAAMVESGGAPEATEAAMEAPATYVKALESDSSK